MPRIRVCTCIGIVCVDYNTLIRIRNSIGATSRQFWSEKNMQCAIRTPRTTDTDVGRKRVIASCAVRSKVSRSDIFGWGVTSGSLNWKHSHELSHKEYSDFRIIHDFYDRFLHLLLGHSLVRPRGEHGALL